MKLPAEVLDDRIAIVGTSGSGKTVTGKLGVEALLDDGARVCVVDALSVWHGLRSNAAGTGPGFPITIFGGPHGDLPLTENAGEVIAEAIATGSFSCIVDLSELPSQAKRRRFMQKFAETLYAKNKHPLHLILDEADLWAPQKPLEDIAALLGSRIDEIVRRGRARGFVPWLITQRPAVIHKDVLSQLDTLIAMKLTSSQDRAALGAWIEGQADKAEEKRILGALPALSVGEGFIWSPGHGMLKQVKFSMIRTFDSSRTPKRGERVKVAAGRATVDLEAIRSKLATVETEATQNDPKALRAEIAKLKQQIAGTPGVKQALPVGATKADLDAAHGLGLLEGEAKAREKFIEQMDRAEKVIQEKLDLWVRNAFTEARGAMLAHQTVRGRKLADGGARAAFERAKAAAPTVMTEVRKPAPNYARGDASGEQAMPKMDRTILTVLAQYPQGLSTRQLEIHTTHTLSGGSGASALARMRASAWIETGADRLNRITDLGLAALGPYDPLPTGSALRQHWLSKLGKMEATILSAVCDVYPGGLTTAELAEVTGHVLSGGSGASALAKLRGLGLVEGKPIVASAELF